MVAVWTVTSPFVSLHSARHDPVPKVFRIQSAVLRTDLIHSALPVSVMVSIDFGQFYPPRALPLS